MEHPFVKGAYAAKKYAFVADYVRFWALYHCGGVYLDTDMYMVRNMDDLLRDNLFVGWENKEQTYINVALFGASKNNECVETILNMYDTLEFNTNNMDKFIVPRIITPIVLLQENIVIYPYDYFYPFPYEKRQETNFIRYQTKFTYVIHLWDLSWKPWYQRWMGNIVRIYKTIKRNLCTLNF